jgi:conjugal transfer pilus assembly protein TraF
MKSILLTLLLVTPLLSQATQQEQPWQSRHAEGWAWYQDFKKPQEPKQIKETPQATPQDPIVILGIVKEELERALAQAMLEPTTDNVGVYMALQKKWIDQSAHFSRLWQQNILEHPELASLTPTTQYGVQVKKEVDATFRKNLIQLLSQSNTLLFFYEGGNPFSKAFAEVVLAFSKEYKWSVKSIAVDGIPLQNFPNSIMDATVAQEMNVNFFPALFAVDISTLQATPLAYGMVTTRQIEENIVMQFEDRNND